MKKLIIGLAAIGGIIALWSVAGRGAQKMREHCKEMMASCKGQPESSETLERSEPNAPQSVAKGEAVAV